MSQVTEQLLQAVKSMDSSEVASILSELQSNPQMAQRAGLDTEIKEILQLLGGAAAPSKALEKVVDDIDDEEKFLYGDSEEPKPPPVPEPVRHHSLDLYADVTEEALYGDYPPQKAATPLAYSHSLGAATHPLGPPNQNIVAQVSHPSYPPGTEPLEDSERQALEEYEKIQDLLKTIGLDLGVAEISKMAARTKERLHGNKPPPKTPTRRRRFSSDSSDGSRCSPGHRRRSHSSSSSSSEGRGRGGRGGRGGSWSSDEDDDCRRSSVPPKPPPTRDVKEAKAELSDAAPPPPPLANDPLVLPPPPGVPIPTYPPPQVHSIMTPNFPPPGYNQYGNYMPYMPQQWPPMYAPPSMSLPPQTGTNSFPTTLPYKPAYSKAAAEVKGQSCLLWLKM